MKRIAAACLLLLAGCSSAPVADLMDRFWPGRLEPAPGYHGGVGAPPQQPPPTAPESFLQAPRPPDGSLPPPTPPAEGPGVR
jgi:hypothetical protein